jgi:transcriptional regulator with XRE-family HTH domain
MEKAGEITTFGKQIKYRLIDLGKTQTWLQEQVTAKTGLFVDSSYMYKIITGKRPASKVVQAICEILDIPEAQTE